MPPSRKRRFFVIVIDIRAKFVRNILYDVLVHKALMDSNDEARVVFVNYKGSGADHNYHVFDDVLRLADMSVMRLLDAADQERITTDCDLMAALYAAANKFHLCTDTSIYSYQLLLLSDFRLAGGESAIKVEDVATVLEELEIRFTAVADQHISYGDASMVAAAADLTSAMEQVRLEHATDALQRCVEIAQWSGGVVTGPQNAVHFVEMQGDAVPKQDWLVSLMMNGYQFLTRTRKIFEKEAATIRRCTFKRKPTYHRTPDLDEPAGASTELPAEDVVRAFAFHGVVLTLPKDVEEGFKPKGPRSFKVLGFVDRRSLPPVYFGGKDAFCVTADLEYPRAACFGEFVESVLAKDKYVLASRVYNNNNAPRPFLLIPQPDHWFLMTNLCDAARDLVRPQCPPVAAAASPMSAAMQALRQLSLGRNALLHPSAQVGRSRMNTIRRVRQQIAGVDAREPPLTEEIPVDDEIVNLVATEFTRIIAVRPRLPEEDLIW